MMGNMSNVEFQEETVENFQSRRILDEKKTPKMAAFLINKGLVKSRASAIFTLILLIVACLGLAAYIYFSKVSDRPRNKELTTKDIVKFNEEFERNKTESQ